MIDSFVSGLFSTDGFMPHGMCYQWQPSVLGIHVISDGLISLAYLSISGTLLYFVRRRIDLKHQWIFLCFAIFIIACGFTHAMEIWTIWHPTYWVAGGIKLVTAFASVSTAILLIRYFPSALRLPAPSAMHRIVQLETINRSLVEDSARSAIAADAAGLGFWTFDVATKALHWDESMYRLYGLLASQGAEPDALRESRSHLEDHAKSEPGVTDAPEGGRDYDPSCWSTRRLKSFSAIRAPSCWDGQWKC